MTTSRTRRTAGSIHRMGIGASGGLAAGPAHLILSEESTPLDTRLEAGDAAAETRRFRLAVRRSRDEIQALRECLASDPEDPGLRVLDAHLLLLEDETWLEAVREGIHAERRPASVVVTHVFQKLISSLEASEAEYFRGRAADIRDVRRRVLRHLEGDDHRRSTTPAGAILVATELSPSEAASFDPTRVRAMVTDHGGATSHAAILARARGIPAVVGLVDLANHVLEGDMVLVDADRGEVIVRPTPSEQKLFDERVRRARARDRQLRRADTAPAITLDSHPVTLLANIETPSDAETVAQLHFDGIGLFRTEFFFLASDELPDEEGQVRAYRRVLRRLRPHPVTIRTFDLGGDKFASYLGTTRDDNPFLGVRGIRFLLRRPDVLRAQLRAILRASSQGTVRVLYPMITCVEELRAANAMLEEVRRELAQQGHLVDRVPRGVMIETPAAVTLADLLARECDFFSIGSNDLIQYTLAVDRANQNVAYLYDPFHPAVLRALRKTLDAGARMRIPVTSCGEMSANVYGAAMLLGLGCSQLSMSPAAVRPIKNLIRHARLVDLRRMAEEAMFQATAAEVRHVVESAVREIVGDDVPPLPALGPPERP